MEGGEVLERYFRSPNGDLLLKQTSDDRSFAHTAGEEELDQIRLSQETQNLVVEKEAMSLAPGSQMEEGQDIEEEDVCGRSTVSNRRSQGACPLTGARGGVFNVEYFLVPPDGGTRGVFLM